MHIAAASRTGQLFGQIQPPLRLIETCAGLTSDATPVRDDVVGGLTDAGARSEQSPLQQRPAASCALLVLLRPGKSLVEAGIGLFNPPQRVDRVYRPAAMAWRTFLATVSARAI
ncbi:hypothetical protein OQI_26525, partial [Streptomyces pharetrae CZA14]